MKLLNRILISSFLMVACVFSATPAHADTFTMSIDGDQTVDTSVTQYVTIHFSVTFTGGGSGNVSVSQIEPCSGTVVSPSPSSFSSSGNGTISLGPFAFGQTGTMCFYVTGTRGSEQHTVITTVTLVDGGN